MSFGQVQAGQRSTDNKARRGEGDRTESEVPYHRGRMTETQFRQGIGQRVRYHRGRMTEPQFRQGENQTKAREMRRAAWHMFWRDLGLKMGQARSGK